MSLQPGVGPARGTRCRECGRRVGPRGVFLYVHLEDSGRIEVWLCGRACLARYEGEPPVRELAEVRTA